MGINSVIDTLTEVAKKPISDIAFDRMRNNFYGYVLTSLLIFNLENILLVLKSKEPIEMTLIYIGVQKDFFKNFFAWPIAYGIIAAIIMPITTAIYALIIGVISAIRDDSNSLGIDLWHTFKNNIQIKRKEAKIKKDELEEKMEELIRLKNLEDSRLDTLSTTRRELESYLIKLAGVYGHYRNNYSVRDMKGLLEKIEEEDISKHFPNSQQLNDLIDFVRENNAPSN
ncbi:hypothetical protein AAGR08_01810 [Pantoea sp. BRR-3P]|uniref:hypothetical protein n=1 Tax=Pantoea sp. BRR-3P TaxID=3141541 RepID=UPI0031F4CC67